MKDSSLQSYDEDTRFEAISFPEGDIAFIGMVRVDDCGVNEFYIDLPRRQRLYGQWSELYQSNGFDIDVEISSFGYTSKHNVGNLHPEARVRLSTAEIVSVKKLVESLFSNDNIRNKAFPFTISETFYSGKITYSPGWAAQ